MNAYVLLIEAPDQDATIHTFGDDVDEVRFDHYYFSRYADETETLEYLGHCLTELAGSAGVWPTELWDEYVGLVKEGIANVRWEVAPDIGWEHLEWRNPEETKR